MSVQAFTLAALALAGTAGCGFESSPLSTPSGAPPDAAEGADGNGGGSTGSDAGQVPIDAAEIDAPVDSGPATPAPVCFGPAGVFQVCLEVAPANAITLPAQIDTETSSLCRAAQPIGWTTNQAQPTSCFIVGNTITLSGLSTTTVTGKRPLVLVAATSITIGGALDASGRHGAPGLAPASSSDCAAFARAPSNSGNSGGGGAGGSFMSVGGNGGKGGPGTNGGEPGAPETRAPTHLRGGCAGQIGGGRGGSDIGAGSGGGAVYLVSGGSLVISGASSINVSGGGAAGGSAHSGGSGAGSGGMIVLHSPSITTLAGVLIANGGGGSGGGSELRGTDGNDPSLLFPLVGARGGGNGGAGSPSDSRSGGNGTPGNGGGGGGGGAGFIRSNQALGIAVVSPAAQIVP